MPVYRSSVVDFFLSSHGSTCLPCVLGSGKTLSQRIRSSPYWIEMIFDRAAGGIKSTHVDALLLSLASAKIIEVRRVNGEDQWGMVMTKPNNKDAGVPTYTEDGFWRGVNVHHEGRARKHDATLLLNTAVNVTEENDSVDSASDDDGSTSNLK